MKKYFSLLLLISMFFIFQSCKKDSRLEPAWIQVCDDVSGGNLQLKIDGKDWTTGCVDAVYSEIIDTAYTQKIFWMFGYNSDVTFYQDTDIEMFYLIHSETIINGQTESSIGVGFVEGFFDYSQIVNNPDYEFMGNSFVSNENPNDELTISQLNTSWVDGTLNVTLVKEDAPNETIIITGAFEANL